MAWKPTLNVFSPTWPSSASSATTSDESSPPDSSTPTGTSATIRRRTASRSASRVASRQSRAFIPAYSGGARVRAASRRARSWCRPADGADGGRRQLAHAGQDGPRRRHHRVERHVVVQRDRVERGVDVAGGQQRGQRGGEAQPARRLGQVQRLDAQPVAGQGEHAGVAVGHGEGEHAQEVVDAVGAPAVERLDQHLGVGGGEEPVAVALQLVAQLLVVVDAAVEHRGQAEVGVDHRLGAALGQVDDLQPAVPERDRPGGVQAGAVGAARCHRGGDPGDRLDVRATTVAREPDLPGDAAHARPPDRRSLSGQADAARRNPLRVSSM